MSSTHVKVVSEIVGDGGVHVMAEQGRGDG